MAEQLEHPQGIGGPPVEVVPVEHDSRVPADALLREQPGEALAVEVVAGDLVVQLGVPVDLDRPRDVAGFVEEDVLVGLHHHEIGVVEVVLEPVARHQHLGVGVGLEGWGGVVLDGHEPLPFCTSVRRGPLP
jgi:hypothetical protein